MLNIAKILAFVTGKSPENFVCLKSTLSIKFTQPSARAGVILMIQRSLIFTKGLAMVL